MTLYECPCCGARIKSWKAPEECACGRKYGFFAVSLDGEQK